LSFYTSVEVVGNRIAYRGYSDNGTPISQKYEFKPTLFLPHKEETGYKSLDGLNVKPFTLDSPRELKEFVKTKEGLEGFKYYGVDRPIMQFLQEKFPKEIPFKKEQINIVNFDIEVYSEEGFPRSEEAAHPIVSITAKSSKSKVYHVWGLKEYNPEKSLYKHLTIQYHRCDSEVDLLVKFLHWWKSDYPDVVTGWNIRFYDIPYIVNRLRRLGSEEAVKRLSPWGQVREKQIQFQKRNMDSYAILGVNQMDYYDLFTKYGVYSYGPQESYKLDHIAHVVLGERKQSYEDHQNLFKLLGTSAHVKVSEDKPVNKLEEFEKWALVRNRSKDELKKRNLDKNSTDLSITGPKSFEEIYLIDVTKLSDNELNATYFFTNEKADQEAHQVGIDYNIKDVELIDRMDEKLDLMGLAFTVAYKAGVNYNDIFGTTAIWDSIVYRELMKKNVIVPSLRDRNELSKLDCKFAGGYVKNVKPGMYDWVVSFDLASLYPNIIAQWNMSPETFLKTSGSQLHSGVEHYLDNHPPSDPVEKNASLAANGTMYDNTERGILPEIIVEYYAERKKVKNHMLDLERDNQISPTADLEKGIAQAQNKQMAIKILMNSLFGAVGNRWYRHFDLKMAEGITLTGQFIIKWCERTINKELNKILGTTDQDFVIAIDTDSLYVDFHKIIEKFKPENPVKFLDNICAKHFDPMFKKSMEEVFNRMNCFDPRMAMEREVIADRAIWTAKKRYILNVHNSEGIQYAKPKLKILGIEAIKSSTPQVVRSWMREAFPVMMNGTELEVQSYIRECKEKFKSLKPEDLAAPRGANEIEKWSDPRLLYKKGCPIHVRGALIYNKLIDDLGLENQYEKIKSGTKLKYTYMRLPNPTKENVISFPDYFPPEFLLEKYIDYDLQFDKAFLNPLQLILNSIGWESEPTATLDDFFS
jgi:DNA polymerase elongation subunit (family B)